MLMERSGDSAVEPLRILIVDDSLTEIQATVSALRRCGYIVEHVIDGTLAIKAVLDTAYNCILVDLHMPAMGGRELVDYWSMEAPELLSRVIVMSGFHGEASRLEERVCGVLLKPYAISDLERAVDGCIKGQAE